VNKWSLLWKIPSIAIGVVLGMVILLMLSAAGIMMMPSARKAIVNKCLQTVNERTDLDVDLDRLYLSPLYHSPIRLYRAYKGKADLPLRIEVDNLYVGHRGQDTLIYVHSLRLRATLRTSERGLASDSASNFLSVPIVVDELHLSRTTFHSDSLLAAVGIDAIVGSLDVRSPELNIAKGQYPLHGLHLKDTYVGISLYDTPPDTTAQDSVPMLMAFDVPDGELSHVQFVLMPAGMNVRTDTLAVNVLADVGGNKYDVRRIDAGGTSLTLGGLFLPFDTIAGEVCADMSRSLITSRGLYVRSDSLGAEAGLSATVLDLETMRVDVAGDAAFRGSKVQLGGYYDIDDETYDLTANVERVNLSPLLQDSTQVVVACELHAEGKGIDPNSSAMRSKVHLHMTEGIYDNINVSGLRLDAELADKTVGGTLHLPFTMQDSSIQVKAETEHQFRVAEFMTPERMRADYHALVRSMRGRIAGEKVAADSLDIRFATGSSTTLSMATKGLNMNAKSPMHVLRLAEQMQPLLRAASDTAVIRSLSSLSDLTMLDTLRRLIPEMTTDIVLTHGSPVQNFIGRSGMDINKASLLFNSDSDRTELTLDVSTPEISHPDDSTALRLPAASAAAYVTMTEGKTSVSLAADSRLTDGAMAIHKLKTNAALRLDMQRTGRKLSGAGCLMLDSLSLDSIDLGNRTVDIEVAPSQLYANAVKADIRLDDLPLDLVDSILHMPDIDLKGAIRASATIDGLPGKFDLSARVLPMGVSAMYKPYEVELSLAEQPITMEHNRLRLDRFRIYGADSTYLALSGGLDLDHMRLDVTLAADSFAPAKLLKESPSPVHGDLAVDIHGRATGPLDKIVADVDVSVLPVTDITYQIDKKNLAQVKPHGKVNVRYAMADNSLDLDGQINVDEGFIRYSPKAYPIMPFHVDSGSHIAFRGPVGKTMVNVSASQQVKASVQSEGEDSRRVDFLTGVRVQGEVDSIGLNAIGFFLEAPEDETITRELASLDEDTREGLAATLLATGMYVGESNAGAQDSGYALTSIINSRINAAMANSKVGKFIDVDVSSGKSQHANGETNDLNIAVSKSFFKDRFRVSLGASISDNFETTSAYGLNNLSAEYKLTKDGNVLLRAFAQRDFNNILEGELYKSGIGVRATQQWEIQSHHPTDTITRIYGLTADADIAWRSNNSLGPNLTLTSSIKNLFGRGETFSVKGNGAYYWALRDRHPNDPKKTDTYKLGVSTALVFPYLHWTGDDNPDGETRYALGYQYENIAGGYGVHRVSGSLTYFIRSSRYITHSFTPFSLSVVRMKMESDSLMNKAADYPHLFKLFASDEFVPAIGYHFTYSDYRDKRGVNTMLDLGVKESGNLINTLYCAFGYKWNDKGKRLGSITFDQFVKLTAELRNRFNFTEKVCIATRLFAGANIPLGNSENAPLSEAFYTGGPNSMRATSPYAYGPGNFYSAKYNQSFFHAGDVKLEANFELRFPIVWKLFGAAFVDAGNVWTWYNTTGRLKQAGYDNYIEKLGLVEDLQDGFLDNPDIARQIALGTGAGLRLDFDGLVIRLDLGVAIHAPYQTFKRKKNREFDYDQPINTYFNIPTALDALRINFGIGYPF